MRFLLGAAMALGLAVGCGEKKGGNADAVAPRVEARSGSGNADVAVSLVEARKGFQTNLTKRQADKAPAAVPPPALFRAVRYDAPSGPSSAYVTPDPKDGKKHPAIVWITGGDCNSIDAGCWKDGNATNDQSASAYRKAGLMMMFPSLRGGNDSPGVKEGFLGEVDDVIAAGEYLREQSYVDPERIYLGGHSTGGTLVLLVSEYTNRFRAVFSFGPADDVSGYGPEYCPFPVRDAKEVNLRSPGRWLHSIARPTFVFEGATGNAEALRSMSKSSKNANARFFEVAKTDHFAILAPTNELIAEKILKDVGPTCNLAFADDEIGRLFRR